ncbi:Alpha/Beta hydrolase protein [Phlebopus sp. FC_14]|nr:Alpha/Beta hydrolase protein [Phlebopus sp. FC_14]
MSSLYRSAISARIAKLPHLPQTDEDDAADESNELCDSLGSLPIFGMGPPPLPHTNSSTPRTPKEPNPAFSPISPSSYFSQALQVSLPSRGLDVRVYYTPPRFEGGGLIVLHHGAGYAGTSFTCLAKEISGVMRGKVGVLTFDARRHGKTTSTEPDDNLSMDILVDDFVSLTQTVFPDPAHAPVLMLVGHSMGGSVVVRACPKIQNLHYTVSGVAVLDVVEGTAIEALPHMHALLNSRPEGFDSIEEAIEWHVNTHTINNPISARISIPSILIPRESTLAPRTRANEPYAYRWRTPLRSTAPYWDSWFSSLSSLFLSLRSARLLVLAGAERLDTPLMVGQMQGKFWLEVMSERGVGHLVHEDDPTRLAEILSEFWKRNEKIEIKGKVVKRVGET